MSLSKLSVLCVVHLSSLQSNGHGKPVANNIGSLDDAPIRSLTEKFWKGSGWFIATKGVARLQLDGGRVELGFQWHILT